MNLIALPPSFELDLQLPKETKQTVDNQLFYSFEPEEFRLVLKIFNNYEGLATTHKLLIKDIEQLEIENQLFLSTLNQCNATLNNVNNDREFIYKLRESDIKKAEDKNKLQKIKTALFASGGVAVGIGIGILIGIFAI